MKHWHHIIPRHMGGSEDPSNLIELSVEEHAEAHKLLFEQFGLWQDYLAWKGLEGRMTTEECAREAARLANLGRKDNLVICEKKASGMRRAISEGRATYPTRKGMKSSAEHKAKIAMAMLGNKNGRGNVKNIME